MPRHRRFHFRAGIAGGALFGMRLLRPVLLAAWGVTIAHGSSLRTLPLINPRSNSLESKSIAAKILGIQDRTGTALIKAQSARSLAVSATLASEEVHMQALTAAAELHDLSDQATAQAEAAARASEGATGNVQNMEASKEDELNQAKTQTIDRVRDMFTTKFKALTHWREHVLRDPHSGASLEERKAAKPYRGASDVFYNRIHAYQAQARSLARESTHALADATALADAAQTKNKAGDIVGASEDLARAKSFQDKSTAYAETAKVLQASAVDMSHMVVAYDAAEQVASARVAHETDPSTMPALRVDPNLANAPPPCC